MQKIKLMFELNHGPIWNSDPFTGQPTTGVEAVDDDPDLVVWNNQCSKLYDECYEVNSHGKGCYFNQVTLAKHRQELLSLLDDIKQRLAELNHDNFVLEDQATGELEEGTEQ